MKRLAFTLASCLLVQALTAAPAHAHIWRWIEELSGPGPFNGWMVEGRLVCWAPEDKPTDQPSDQVGTKSILPGGKLPCLIDRVPKGKLRRYSLNFEVGALWAKDNHLEYPEPLDEDQRRVKIIPLQATLYWQLYQGLEVGHGIGFYSFYNKQGLFGTFHRWTFEPMRVDWRPVDMMQTNSDKRFKLGWKILRMLTIRQSVVFIPKGFNAANFGSDGAFKTEREVLPTLGLILDVEPLLSKK